MTIVTADRQCLFADAVLRSIIQRCWSAIPRHSPRVSLDAWVVMPNHLHGVLMLDHAATRLRDDTQSSRRHVPPASGSLGAIVGTFKSVSARRINRIRQAPGTGVWQRNYYERIVRTECELGRIREYIAANPTRWGVDVENPNRTDARDKWTADEALWFGTVNIAHPYP